MRAFGVLILAAGLAGITLFATVHAGSADSAKVKGPAVSIQAASFMPAHKEGDTTIMPKNYHDIPFKTITGHDSSLAAFEGKVLLVVNVASECGYTPQYAGLEKLYEQYKSKGLVVIGFPANNFGGQEPGTNEQIAGFCTSKFGVSFPMMAKISVSGEDKHPLFVQLTEKSDLPGEIKWNFSKFLFDRSGKLVARFPSAVEPLSPQLTSKVESLF